MKRDAVIMVTGAGGSIGADRVAKARAFQLFPELFNGSEEATGTEVDALFRKERR